MYKYSDLYRLTRKPENMFSKRYDPVRLIKGIQPTKEARKLAKESANAIGWAESKEYRQAQSHRVAVFAFITDEIGKVLEDQKDIFIRLAELGAIAYAWDHACYILHPGHVGTLGYAFELFDSGRNFPNMDSTIPEFPPHWRHNLGQAVAKLIFDN